MPAPDTLKSAPASSPPARRGASNVSIFCRTTWYAAVRSGRRRLYTAARFTTQLPTAIVPRKPTALLIIKAQIEIPTAGRDPQKRHPCRLRRKRGSGSPVSTDPANLCSCPLAGSMFLSARDPPPPCRETTQSTGRDGRLCKPTRHTFVAAHDPTAALFRAQIPRVPAKTLLPRSIHCPAGRIERSRRPRSHRRCP